MLSNVRDLLIEIGTEELPPKALLKLAISFRSAMKDRLASRRILTGEIEYFATPRRLALLVRKVAEKQGDTEVSRRGPAIASAFSHDGIPTKAALGFARSCGTTVELLDRESNEKGEWLCYRTSIVGEPTMSLIPDLVQESLAGLPIPKRMRWGSGSAEFVRPVHWVCIVFGDETVPGSVLDVSIGGSSRGHRFHHPASIPVVTAERYPQILREIGHIEPSFESRRSLVESKVIEAAIGEGLVAEVDEVLLDEVTGLVEWPSAVVGRFDEEFLAVPAEVLIETMKKHQKYFPIRDSNGELVARFIAVANIDSTEPEAVRSGNERVIRPRFADAKFFWDIDRKKPLEQYFPKLEAIVYQQRLGSVADKSRRVQALGVALARSLGVDAQDVESSAILGKCDLVSAMVGEFPGLQGIMGRYYAAHSGASETVSRAIEEQYLPRFSGDRIPSTGCGKILAIADRLDTLVGIFGVGFRPSGAKDPYGLRRASIAVLRILIEAAIPLNLKTAIATAESGFPPGTIEAGVGDLVFDYMMDRVSGHYQERGIAPDTVAAVLATGEEIPLFLDKRILAVSAFRSLPEAQALAGANKRIRNILAKGKEGRRAAVSADECSIDVDAFQLPEERALWDLICSLEKDISSLVEDRDYGAVLERLATLRETVDGYFESVMVNVDDVHVRRNRLAVLEKLMGMFLGVADISRLQ